MALRPQFLALALKPKAVEGTGFAARGLGLTTQRLDFCLAFELETVLTVLESLEFFVIKSVGTPHILKS